MSEVEQQPNTESARGSLASVDRFEEGNEHFRRVRELGERGVWTVMHPYTGEHMDVVDFDIEIAERKSAGIATHEFWSAPLHNEVDN